eukprot:3919384-Rhodomonas_salina.1
MQQKNQKKTPATLVATLSVQRQVAIWVGPAWRGRIGAAPHLSRALPSRASTPPPPPPAPPPAAPPPLCPRRGRA